MSPLAPARRRGREILDDPGIGTSARLASMGDVIRSNGLFGGRRAALLAVSDLLVPGASLTVLDVGTGLADIPKAVGIQASERGATVTTIGLDESMDLLQVARQRLTHAVRANAMTLPIADRGVDVVMCSQVLHHFPDDDLAPVVRELNRVARLRVVIADLRRSRVAAAGFWLASFPLRFHPVTRHDGVVSVFRGFTAGELRETIRAATGVVPSVRHRLGFRLTATWTPA